MSLRVSLLEKHGVVCVGVGRRKEGVGIYCVDSPPASVSIIPDDMAWRVGLGIEGKRKRN